MRIAILAILVLASAVTPAIAQSPLDLSVTESTQVLREIMAVPLRCIPHSLLHKAHGIAIIPNLKKAGLIVGVEHGKGVFVARDDCGQWQAPVFVSVSGGSVGLQAGVHTTDLVLVFMTKRSVDRTLKGRVHIGADLAAAAGPLGRDTLIATDGPIRHDVVSYSRAHGLFIGLTFSGATLHTDFAANAAYYAHRPGQPHTHLPTSAVALVQALTLYDPPPTVVPAAFVPGKVLVTPPTAPPDDCEQLRQQLVAAALRLQNILDPTWQQYLALPREVFTGQPLPSGVTYDPVLQRFRAVSNDPRYWALIEHHEFQETQSLLRRFAAHSHPRPAGTLALPLPPVSLNNIP